MKQRYIPLAVLLLAINGAPKAYAKDSGQICMFRCAPMLGTDRYDACVSECFAEEEGYEQDVEARPSNRVDISSLHGYWHKAGSPCGTVTYEFLNIDETGASGYETSCEIQSSTREGATYTLNQQCEFGDVWESTLRIRSIKRGEIDVDGERYRKCPRP